MAMMGTLTCYDLYLGLDQTVVRICIKRLQGVWTHTHLPITTNVLQTLKTQLCHYPPFSPNPNPNLLWAAPSILAFYAFLRASEFATAALIR